MTPTSGSLLLCTIALALLSAVATALLWNRMRGPRAARVAQRGALLLFGELMAATAILVWVNISNGGLVVSWQDLLGNQSTRGGVFAGQAGVLRGCGDRRHVVCQCDSVREGPVCEGELY